MKYAMSFVLLVALSNAIAGDGKVTEDPNVGAGVEQQAQNIDLRLTQRVTYHPGYARLHDVAEGLAELTGVSIRAGHNKQDWRVRDIPLIVCAKDLTLGRLLQSIASAAHVELRAERITQSDDKPIYRFIRGRKKQEAILSKLDARARANLELAGWAWDALALYANTSDTPPPIPEDRLPYSGADQEIKLVSKLVASLGPEGRAKAFAGDKIALRTDDPRLSPLLTEFFRYVCTRKGCFQGTPVEPTDDEIRDALITVGIARVERQDYIPGGFTVQVDGKPILVGPDQDRLSDTWTTDAVRLAKAVAGVKEVDIPPVPDIHALMKAESRPSDTSLKPIETEDDWKTPLLQATFGFELPKKYRLTRADVVPVLARVSGISIISEDFESHRLPWASAPMRVPRRECTVADAVKGLSADKHHAMAWFVDDDSKLVVGWNDDWRKHHQALAPDGLLAGVRAKREGKGAELDDVIALLALPDDQYDEWVRWTWDFPDGAGYVDPWDRPAWLLYNALSPEDRTLARSDAGLPLAKLDAPWVSGFFQETRRRVEEAVARQQTSSIDSSTANKLLLFSEPNLAPSLVMRVRRVPLKYWTVRYIGQDLTTGQIFVRAQPNMPEKHSYVVELAGKSHDEDFHVTAEWRHMQFPLLTVEREAELARKASGGPDAKK